MIEHVKKLEKKSNKERTHYVKQVLEQMGVAFSVQPFRQRILRGENIIVEVFCGNSSNQLMLTAHTNKYFSSPGANDNASGIVVLLEIIKHIKQLHLKKNTGIKIAFFDHEDGLAILDGSSYFVNHTDMSKISFVLNLDGVGMGDSVTISPMIKNNTSNDYINFLLQCLEQMSVKHFSFDLPPFMVEDHMPFIKKSVTALSVNIMPEHDFTYLKSIINKSWMQKLKISLVYRGFNSKNHPMTIMRHRHNELDTSFYIQEKSLQLAFQLTMKMIDYHTRKAVVS